MTFASRSAAAAHAALAAVVAMATQAPAASGQDVELLGEIYGTRPPAEYFVRKTDPGAFEFARPMRRAPRNGGGLLREARVPLGPRNGPVAGTFTFPVVLGLFSDTPGQGPFSPSEIQQAFFDGPSPTGTVRDLYTEMSRGMVDVRGETLPWHRSSLTLAEVAGGSSGLGAFAQVGEFIVELVAQLDSSGVDWGVFDSDGPDGIPNSGDDDGFVDVLTVMHATVGAECSGDETIARIWSHRFTLAAQGTGPYTTGTPSANGGFLRVDDYTIQPSISCDGVSRAEIGVFAHELGHGFGLPDLYAVGNSIHQGIGKWGLMGSGAWGCPGPFNPHRPCHMSAWTKRALGWINPTRVASGRALGRVTLSPVASTGEALEIVSGDGSGQYLLIENRQPIGFDDNLTQGGLLVWRVDPAVTNTRWAFNLVNSVPSEMGVELLEADGLGDLARSGGGRGDPGDLFPGSTGNVQLHASSNPATRSGPGGAMGITLLDIQTAGTDVSFDLWTRFQELRIESRGAPGPEGAVAVDGTLAPSRTWVLRSAPFQEHSIVAEAGASVAPGQRIPFLGWQDGGPRERSLVTGFADTSFVAEFGGLQYEVAIAETSAQPTVDPADMVFTPESLDGWVEAGSTVGIEARARTGFLFREWGGAFAGAPNPTSVTVTAPIAAEARFDVTFTIATDSVAHVEAARPADILLQTNNGNAPEAWTLVTGELPPGLVLDGRGAIPGSALELGSYPLELRVRDALGLEASLMLHVEVGPPTIALDVLSGPFLGSALAPTVAERSFLDRVGNGNGRYDLGDLRAFLVLTGGGG